MSKRAILAACVGLMAAAGPWPSRRRHLRTTVSIAGDCLPHQRPADAEGPDWRGHRVEGLLPNSRMVQGVFDDLNPETRGPLGLPGHEDVGSRRNTREFVAAMRAWRERGCWRSP